MSERIRAAWINHWTCVAAGLVVALVGAAVVAAPLQNQKKSAPGKIAADSSKKNAAETPAAPAKTPATGPVVAKVNGEEITYKALAEEVIARKGKEVLDTMISRLLVEQACRERGIKITAQEIHDEINRTAERLNMTPEQYLKVLKDRRDMSYEQYERDIVWPGLALKKMARQYVKVTEDDIEKGFEAYYGEKMRCRWIMLNDLPTAMKVWDEMKKSDKRGDGKIDLAEFERQVTRWSVDPGSRSLGGQLQPISRHTSPAFKAIEDAAFGLKEDGEVSKVVQFGEAWVILYREGRIPPQNVKIQDVRDKIEADIYEAKMRDQIEQVFLTLQRNSTVENLLTGEVTSPERRATAAEHVETQKSSAAPPASKGEPAKKNTAPKK